jgi:hypothetical protein
MIRWAMVFGNNQYPMPIARRPGHPGGLADLKVRDYEEDL